MAGGVFRRPFQRAPQRRIVHGVAAVVIPSIPVRRPRQPMHVRRPFVIRRVAAFIVAGKGRAVPVVPVAKILLERHRKIMMDRLARLKPVVATTPLVGATPFPVHPFISRPPAPLRVPSRVPVTGVPAPVVGSTPFPARPAIPRPPTRLPPQAKVPPFVFPAVGSTPFPATPTFRRVPAPRPKPVRVPVFGVPAAPGVGSVPFLLRPSFTTVPSRTMPQRAFTVPTAVPVGEVTVCTSGTWSSVISFVACDTYRLEIDGPALDNPKVSVAMEFEE